MIGRIFFSDSEEDIEENILFWYLHFVVTENC